MNKKVIEILSCLGIFVITIIGILIYISVMKYYEDECISNGGTPIYKWEIYEKCIGGK